MNCLPDSAILPGEPFTTEETARLISRFQREGYCDLGPVLELEEVEALREDMQRKWDDAAMHEPERDQIRGTSLMRMFEYSAAFRDLIVREPFASLAEAILGEGLPLHVQNALYTPPDPGAVTDGPGGWHLDDLIHFPLPRHIPRHSPDVPLPCFVVQVFTPLTDVEELRHGPTQIVPGSHFAGRRPEVQDQPCFDGNGPHYLPRPPDPRLHVQQPGLAQGRPQHLGPHPPDGRGDLQQAVRLPEVLPLHRLPHARATSGRGPRRGCSACSGGTPRVRMAEQKPRPPVCEPHRPGDRGLARHRQVHLRHARRAGGRGRRSTTRRTGRRHAKPWRR